MGLGNLDTDSSAVLQYLTVKASRNISSRCAQFSIVIGILRRARSFSEVNIGVDDTPRDSRSQHVVSVLADIQCSPFTAIGIEVIVARSTWLMDSGVLNTAATS